MKVLRVSYSVGWELGLIKKFMSHSLEGYSAVTQLN
tara:strand:- start:1634 stop:1741 length:108 start_codon:yes stop_codon:yes gene_type:complete